MNLLDHRARELAEGERERRENKEIPHQYWKLQLLALDWDDI